MTTTDDQRFAPPQAHVQDIATGEPVLAGRGARLLAAIIDGLIAGAAVWAKAAETDDTNSRTRAAIRIRNIKG